MAGWLENLILMKTQLSVWTWTLDFDLGFVNFCFTCISAKYTAENCVLLKVSLLVGLSRINMKIQLLRFRMSFSFLVWRVLGPNNSHERITGPEMIKHN